MSELMAVGQALTMSSREIAELVDSRQWAEHQLAQATQQEAA